MIIAARARKQIRSAARLKLRMKITAVNPMSWDLCRRVWRVLPRFSAAFAPRKGSGHWAQAIELGQPEREAKPKRELL